MSLHCLYADPRSPTGQHLLRLVASGDAVVFLGAAASVARLDHPAIEHWVRSGASLHVLAADIATYGVNPIDPRVRVVDAQHWVALAVAQPNQVLWR